MIDAVPGHMPANALDYITIKGFKSIASVEKLAIKPINIVIGANGSGKSNFIGVFDFLRAVCDGRLARYVTVAGGAEKVLHFGSKGTTRITLEFSLQNSVQYSIYLRPTTDDGLAPDPETIRNGGNLTLLSPSESGREANISDPSPKGHAERVRKTLHRWRPYHLNDTGSSSPMRKTATVDDNRFLQADGANLPAFLYFLRERHPDSYNLIVRTIQLVAPFFHDFRLAPLQLNPDSIKLEWRHKRSEQYFAAPSLSDGTLRFIALATLFLQPEALRPSLILVDEPELGLHPYALELLASLIRQASVTSQVIVSTQSSLLLDHFNPEDVIVADRVDDGTQLTRLDPERLEKWLEDYSLGQLWEKNEFGGRPVPG